MSDLKLKESRAKQKVENNHFVSEYMKDSENSSSGLPHSMTLTLGLIVLISRKIIVLLNDAEPLSLTQSILFSPRKAVMKERWTRLPSPVSQAQHYLHKLGTLRPAPTPL